MLGMPWSGARREDGFRYVGASVDIFLVHIYLVFLFVHFVSNIMADGNRATKRSRTGSSVDALTYRLSDRILVDKEPNPYVKDDIIYVKLCKNTVLERKMILELMRITESEIKIYSQDGYMVIKAGEKYMMSEIKRRSENDKKESEWERYCDVVEMHENGEVELRTFWTNEVSEIKEAKKDYTIYSKNNTIFVSLGTNEQEIQRNGNKRRRGGA